MTAFFALTARGLEPLVQTELAQIEGVRVRARAYRRVHATMDGPLDRLTTVRSADDLFLDVATWEHIRHTRDMLPAFTDRSAALDLGAAVAAIQTVRHVPQPIAFSITANFVGGRNYSYHEIKSAVAAGISQRYPGWTYVEDDHDAGLNVRVFVEHQQALVGVRLAASPLHRRAYKRKSLPGSLKAPVAAAMIQIAGLEKGQPLLDPFCGSGTLVIEAAQQGFTAIGGDSNPQAVQISRENAATVAGSMLLAVWSARRIPLADDSVQAVVSNLPWGKQVEVDASLRSLYEQAFGEMKRVLMPGGVLVLLTTLPELVPERPSESFEISVYGQNPHVLRY